MYAPVMGQSAPVDALFDKLATKVADEAALGEALMGLSGQLELLMAAASQSQPLVGTEGTS